MALDLTILNQPAAPALAAGAPPAGGALPAVRAGTAPAPVQPACTAIAPTVPLSFQKQSATYRDKAQQRLRYVRSVLALARDHRMSEPAAAAVVAETDADSYPLLTGKLSYYNFRTWKKRLGKNPRGEVDLVNVTTLVDRYTGGRRADIDVFPPYRSFFNAVLRVMIDKNKFDLEAAYRLCHFAATHDGTSQDHIPSLGQVRHYLKLRVPAVWLKYRSEKGEFTANKLIGHVTRDWTSVQVNRVWFGDHHTFDAMVRIPCPKSTSGWRAVRPSGTAVMDGKSGMFLSVVVLAGVSPSSLSIQDAVIEAIRCNDMIPGLEWYCDNGLDFKAGGFAVPVTMPDGSEHCILRELDMRLRVALPYRARSKLIERAFRRFASEFAKLWPAYRGNNPFEKPDGYKHFEEHPEDLPTIDEFEAALRWWLENIYHQTANRSSRVSEGRTPAEMWALRTPLRQPLTPEQLWFSMLLPVPRPHAVHPGGVIHFGGEWVAADAGRYTGQELYPLVASGARVMLKIDRLTREQFGLVAFTQDGRILAPLQRKGMAPALCDSEEDYQVLEERTRHSQAMRPWLREQNKLWTGSALARPAEGRKWLAAMAPVAAQLSPASRRDLPPADSAAADSCPGLRSPAESAPIPADVYAATTRVVFNCAFDAAPVGSVAAAAPAAASSHEPQPAAAPDTSSADAAAALKSALDALSL